jgi:hypothetical protein
MTTKKIARLNINTKDIVQAIKEDHRRASEIWHALDHTKKYKRIDLIDIDRALVKAKKAGAIRFKKGAGEKSGWEIGEDPAIARARAAAAKKAEVAEAKKAKAALAAKAKEARAKEKAAKAKARATKTMKTRGSSPRVPGQTKKGST